MSLFQIKCAKLKIDLTLDINSTLNEMLIIGQNNNNDVHEQQNQRHFILPPPRFTCKTVFV